MLFKFKLFREVHDLFQSHMAELLQLSQSTISRMEMRPAWDITSDQLNILYDKFGKEDVDLFVVSNENENVPFISAFGNTNEGSGTQNNGYIANNGELMGLLKMQSEALTGVTEKQIQLNDRLISLLDKLSEKL